MSGNPGLLITGGEGASTGGDPVFGSTSVEVFSLMSRTSCSLPDLPSGAAYHTQHNNLMCGVPYPDGNQCWTRDTQTGDWTVSHTLDGDRSASCMWPLGEEGVLILGGGDDDDTRTSAVLVTPEGEVSQQFSLLYRTR